MQCTCIPPWSNQLRLKFDSGLSHDNNWILLKSTSLRHVFLRTHSNHQCIFNCCGRFPRLLCQILRENIHSEFISFGAFETVLTMEEKTCKKMVVLDGRTGEGGGQLVRIAVCLSALTGTPIRIHHVRGNRAGGKNKAGVGGKESSITKAMFYGF